jgi:hypothetical protein
MLDDDVPCGDPLARLSLPSVPVFGRAKMRTNMRGDANLNCFRRPIPLIRGSHLSFQYDFFPYDAIFAGLWSVYKTMRLSPSGLKITLIESP